MILNLNVNLDFLNKFYELAPFNGLRKQAQDEEDVFEPSSLADGNSGKENDTNNLSVNS